MVKVWTRHKHGKRKRKGWRKLHIGVSNGVIVAHLLSEDRKTDGEIAPHLIKQVGKIESITAEKDMIKVEFTQPQVMPSKKVVKSTPILGQMQLFPLQMKQHLDSEISMSNQSMKTAC